MENSLKEIILENVCPTCGGTGGEVELGEFFPCDECGGGGYVPTEDGKAILKLTGIAPARVSCKGENS